MTDISSLQIEIDRLLAAGELRKGRDLLISLWRAAPTLPTASFIAQRIGRFDGTGTPPARRVAIVRSFTVEPLCPLLQCAAWTDGLRLNVHVGRFNAYAQDLMDHEGDLHRFDPEVVVVAVQTRDISPLLWEGAARCAPEEVDTEIDRILTAYGGWIAKFRQHSRGYLILHNFEEPAHFAEGALAEQSAGGQAAAIRELNRRLVLLARAHEGVYVLGYDALLARHGRLRWYDERKWVTARMPISSSCLLPMAREWLRYLHPLVGRHCKVLAVDLDNTLWGGILGEVGIGGICCGPEHPGVAFRNLQRALLDLRRRGILLAVCSKNNHDEALRALQDHPGLLLRPGDFAAIRANWKPKSENLASIAQELGVGIDSVAFLDDNPVEREEVRMALPEVAVLELPADVAAYAQSLRDCPFFERLNVTSEDRTRSEMYAAQKERAKLLEHVGSVDEFQRALEQEVQLELVNSATAPRVSQLTQKTNQFNLTNRRYSDAEIAAMMVDPACRIVTARVVDRFGDNGHVGVAVLRISNGACEIDTFLLSCRVIGRSVETAMLAWIVDLAKEAGALVLEGSFQPTAKNAPAQDFYLKHGFAQLNVADGGQTRWRLILADVAANYPGWMKISTPEATVQLGFRCV